MKNLLDELKAYGAIAVAYSVYEGGRPRLFYHDS